ncbi:MAG: glycosyltransferase family 4 protein [Saprospiraceae bacterium]
MNILLIHQYFLESDDPGGSRFNEMTRFWTDAGHRVTVLAGMVHYNGQKKRPEYQGRYWVRKEQQGVEVWRCHVSEAYNANFLGRLWGYFSFVFSSVWAGFWKVKGKYDLILVTSPPLFVGGTAWILSRWKRIPFVFEVRDLWPESAIHTGVLQNPLLIRLAYRFEQWMYRSAALVNVLTPAFRETLIHQKGIPPGKVVFIPNAADFSLSDQVLADFDRDEFRKTHGLEGKFVITYVGAHGVANHLVQVLDAAERLQDEPTVLFQLIGDGMQKQMLVREAGARGLTNVSFIDSVPKAEVFKYIAASEWGASILKKVDTFKTIYSNKTFDYMACKVPVLMVIDGVSRQLVEVARCGVFVEPENPAEWERTIRLLIDQPEETRTKMGASGYQYARDHFDRHVLSNRYMQELEQVVLIHKG